MSRRGTWEFPNRVELCAALIPRLVDYGSPPLVPRVLDACNKFVDPRMAKACAEKGYRLWTCDIDPEEHDADAEDLNDLPTCYKDKFFRGIVSSDTLEHVNDMGAVLKEFHRITEDGGWLILHLPVDLVNGGLRGVTVEAPAEDKDHHQWMPGIFTVNEQVTEAGYRIVGMVKGYDRDIFHVSVAWLCVKDAT